MLTTSPDDIGTHLSAVRKRISFLPPHLKVFDRLVELLSRRPDVSLSVSGSLFDGVFDQWSDLDIEVIAHDERALTSVQDWVRAQSTMVAPLLSQFPADHIGLDKILVSFFLEAGVVVKADLFTLTVPGFLNANNMLLIYDPREKVQRVAETVTPASKKTTDYVDLDKKLCGWLWYTHSKIERGEYLEAVNSLEMMRSYALISMLRRLERLPDEGNRRLEAQLRPEWLERLAKTVPAEPSRQPLHQALLALGSFYAELRPAIARSLGLSLDDAALRQMLHMVERGTGIVGAPDV